jgi:hypothetical protein
VADLHELTGPSGFDAGRESALGRLRRKATEGEVSSVGNKAVQAVSEDKGLLAAVNAGSELSHRACGTSDHDDLYAHSGIGVHAGFPASKAIHQRAVGHWHRGGPATRSGTRLAVCLPTRRAAGATSACTLRSLNRCARNGRTICCRWPRWHAATGCKK